MSDAESLGAQDRISREAWVEPTLDWLDENWKQASEPPYSTVEGAIDFAYPLILRAVCQELAAKARAKAESTGTGPASYYNFVAEFVESFGGASPGGE